MDVQHLSATAAADVYLQRLHSDTWHTEAAEHGGSSFTRPPAAPPAGLQQQLRGSRGGGGQQPRLVVLELQQQCLTTGSSTNSTWRPAAPRDALQFPLTDEAPAAGIREQLLLADSSSRRPAPTAAAAHGNS
ncbi:unnamed protein product [Closterium sp. Naga37s-1]|nr:unnamed protein product [Closterium sp. Naga37s-1]